MFKWGCRNVQQKSFSMQTDSPSHPCWIADKSMGNIFWKHDFVTMLEKLRATGRCTTICDGPTHREWLLQNDEGLFNILTWIPDHFRWTYTVGQTFVDLCKEVIKEHLPLSECFRLIADRVAKTEKGR